MKSSNHPWRSRTREFATHLLTLPAKEQRRIKAAEHDYLAEFGDPADIRMHAVIDFAEIMHGVREDVDSDGRPY